jgi:hypothetical protein
MPAITSANVADAIPKVIAANFLKALQPNFLMANLVNRDYEPTFASAGDVVNVPIAPVMTASNMIESGTVTPQNPSLGNAQIVLDSHVVNGFQIPDVTRALAYPDLLNIYMGSAVLAIAERVETDILSQYALFTTNPPTGAQTAMDEARIDLAETQMFQARVPDNQQKYLITNGTAYGELRQIPRFTEFQTGVDRGQTSPIQSGIMALKVKNFITFRSQLVPTVSGTTYNLAFARDALALVVRPLAPPMPGTGAIGAYMELGGFAVRVVMSYQHGMLGQMVTVDVLYGTGVLRQSFGNLILSA